MVGVEGAGGPDARVCGLGRPRGRLRRRVATRSPHVSVIGKKDDLVPLVTTLVISNLGCKPYNPDNESTQVN